MNKKKILFVSPSLLNGGLERVLVTIANKLAQAGYDVTIRTFKAEFDLLGELDERIHFYYKRPDLQLGKKIPYIRYKFYDDDMWQRRATPRQLYRYYVGREKYDVEIAFFQGMPMRIVRGSTNKKAIRLTWVHNDMTKTLDFWDKFRSKEECLELYRFFDGIVCVSKQAAERFRIAVEDLSQIKVVYNMLPVEKIIRQADEEPSVSVDKGKLHIVLVGRIRELHKGQRRLIKIISRLHEEGKDVSLALIGTGPDEQMMKDTIREYHAQSYIKAVGGVLNPYPYIKEADLLVCGSYYEGYNLTVAEAVILNTPVLSTDCTGPKEILDDGRYGMIVENSEEGLYQGIKRLYDSPELLEEYREKEKERLDFFDQDQLLRQLTDLFEDNPK